MKGAVELIAARAGGRDRVDAGGAPVLVRGRVCRGAREGDRRRARSASSGSSRQRWLRRADMPAQAEVYVAELDLDAMAEMAPSPLMFARRLRRATRRRARHLHRRRRHLARGDRSWHHSRRSACHAHARARVRPVSGQGRAAGARQPVLSVHVPGARPHADRCGGAARDDTTSCRPSCTSRGGAEIRRVRLRRSTAGVRRDGQAHGTHR